MIQTLIIHTWTWRSTQKKSMTLRSFGVWLISSTRRTKCLIINISAWCWWMRRPFGHATLKYFLLIENLVLVVVQYLRTRLHVIHCRRHHCARDARRDRATGHRDVRTWRKHQEEVDEIHVKCCGRHCFLKGYMVLLVRQWEGGFKGRWQKGVLNRPVSRWK